MKENNKFKIVHINSVINGSTGRIMNDLAEEARRKGMIVYTSSAGNLYQRRICNSLPKFHIYIGGILENKIHKTLGTIFGCGGCFSQIGTYVFLKKMNKIKPDLIHLHNLHSNYINLKMLFQYIKRHQIPVIWTLHDCWAFTGHCPYFDMVQCNKWKDNCYKCPQFQKYPVSLRDDSAFMYRIKKKLFTNLDMLEIVVPSKWLANLVKQSFLGKYPISVIYNGIDLKTFQEVPSDFRKEYGLEGKIVILGVAFSWGYRKGLDIFIQLVERLPKIYQIVLVGVTDEEKREIPQSILPISLTNSVEELVKIYSSADIFINPTREDNFPTTHIEALACGVPVITFRTGGATESIDETCGRIVEQEDLEGLISAIKEMTDKKISREACVERAKLFEVRKKMEEYLQLYKKY